MIFCEFCTFDFSGMSENQIIDHVNNCLDNIEKLSDFEYSPTLLEDNSKKIKNSNLFDFCLVCNNNLKSININNRINHIKKCAEDFPGVNTNVLKEILGEKIIENPKLEKSKIKKKIEKNGDFENKNNLIKLKENDLKNYFKLFSDNFYDDIFLNLKTKDKIYLKSLIENFSYFENNLYIETEKKNWIEKKILISLDYFQNKSDFNVFKDKIEENDNQYEKSIKNYE